MRIFEMFRIWDKDEDRGTHSGTESLSSLSAADDSACSRFLGLLGSADWG